MCHAQHQPCCNRPQLSSPGPEGNVLETFNNSLASDCTVLILFHVSVQLAKAGCRCDYALYVGAVSDNATILPSIANATAGLKMYLNDTYSTLKMDNVSLWMEVKEFVVR